MLDGAGAPVLANPADPIHSAAVLAPVKDVDDSRTVYARAALSWQPGDDTSVLVAYQYQREHSDGFSFWNAGTDHESAVMWPLGAERSPASILRSLTVAHDFGFASLTSSTSYYAPMTAIRCGTLLRRSSSSTPCSSFTGGYPRSGGAGHQPGRDESAISEELRLVSKTGGAWDYIAGAFFRHQNSSMSQTLEPFLESPRGPELPGSAEFVNAAAYGTNFSTFAQFQQQAIGAPAPGRDWPSAGCKLFLFSERVLPRSGGPSAS